MPVTRRERAHGDTPPANASEVPALLLDVLVDRSVPAAGRGPRVGAGRDPRARRRGAPLRRGPRLRQPAASRDSHGGPRAAGADRRLPGPQRERLRPRPREHLRRSPPGRSADRDGAPADRASPYRGGRARRRAGGDPARHRPGAVRLHLGQPHRVHLRPRERRVSRGVAPRPHRGGQRRRARRAGPQRQLPRHPHGAAGSGAARGDAVARGRAAGPRRGRVPSPRPARVARRGLRPRRVPSGGVPAHAPAARTRRQPRHPISAGRGDGVPAVLRRRAAASPSAIPTSRRATARCREPPSRWTPTSR